jgi:hypothetical protein
MVIHPLQAGVRFDAARGSIATVDAAKERRVLYRVPCGPVRGGPAPAVGGLVGSLRGGERNAGPVGGPLFGLPRGSARQTFE